MTKGSQILYHLYYSVIIHSTNTYRTLLVLGTVLGTGYLSINKTDQEEKKTPLCLLTEFTFWDVRKLRRVVGNKY